MARTVQIMMPPLPGKAFAKQLPFIKNDDGIFEPEFVEERRVGLEVKTYCVWMVMVMVMDGVFRMYLNGKVDWFKDLKHIESKSKQHQKLLFFLPNILIFTVWSIDKIHDPVLVVDDMDD